MYEQANPEEKLRDTCCVNLDYCRQEKITAVHYAAFPGNMYLYSLYKHQTEGDSDIEKQTHASKFSLDL